MSESPIEFPTPTPTGTANIDAELAARLQRLRARREPAAAPRGAPPPRRSRRRHAAAGSRAAALALSLATTGGLTYGFAAAAPATAEAPAQPSGVVVAGTSPAAAAEASTDTTLASQIESTVSVVNGDVFNNKWGPVQVQAEFNPDGSLNVVNVLASPTADDKSVRINDRAIPILDQEAVSVQSANVNTVSGATYTSDDYQRSLQSAIDVARASGLTQIA